MALATSVFLQTCLAALTLLLLVLPCGYVSGWALDLLHFRTRSTIEQALWSTSLSVPVSIVITCVVGRVVPPSATLALLIAAGVFFLYLLARARKQGQLRPWNLDRRAKLLIALLLAEALYIAIAGLPFQVHGKLFEPVFSSDWEIRLPLVDAAVRNAPPRNPFFTYRGSSPVTRYYYYWYSLCAQVVRLTHVKARPALLASSIYAVLAIVSTMLLYLKHMIRSSENLRQRSLLLLGLCCVLGLDVLPSMLGFYFFHVRLQPEVEWWATDRSPGLPGAVIYAPHHVAGAAMGLLAFLFLATSMPEGVKLRTSALLQRALVLAVLFTALVGTSTFICMFFALACSVLALANLRRRNAQYAVVLAIAGVISFAASAPYLHQVLSAPQSTPPSAEHSHFFRLRLRDTDMTHSIIDRFYIERLHRPALKSPIRFVYRAPLFPLLWLSEFGFFLFVIVLQFRRDFRSGYTPSPPERALWMLAGSLGFFFFFVNSTPIQGVNDLGFQAGLVLRLLYIIWGAQIVSHYVKERQQHAWQGRQLLLFRIAVLFLVLGATLTVWQAVVERVYLVLVDHGTIPNAFPFPRATHIATVYNDVFEAQQAAARTLPGDAVIQSDPVGRYQTIFRLYQQRRVAAGDTSCEGAFGGDFNLCQSFLLNILRLYGTREKLGSGAMIPVSTAADKRMDAFAFVCSQAGISAFLASRLDPVWYQPDSWVWRGNLLYGNNTVRVIRCP